jgi:hypothetical protein
MTAFILIACSHNIRDAFDDSFTKYNDVLARNDLRASGLFVADKAKESYITSVNAAKNAKIFEYRIVNKTVSEIDRTARLDVELDYYMLSSNRVKTLRYLQEWIYLEGKVEGKDFKGWKIVTPLPPFK